MLSGFATTDEPAPAPVIREALYDLDVGLVCVDADGVRQMRRMGLTDVYRRAFLVDRTVCLERVS